MGKIDYNYWLIGIVSALFFLPFLGGSHLFDWDEINFAECAREMIVTGDYLRPQINFEPFWEKPPLFIWFQVLSIKLFGINEYAARFPNALIGITTLLTLYHIGKKLYNPTFGLLWVLAFGGSLLPHLYFKSGIIDPTFNLFIFLSLVFYIKTDTPNLLGGEKKLLSYPLSYFMAAGFGGLAILTKGPAGLLIIALTILFKHLIYRELSVFKLKRFVLFALLSFAVALLWFGIITLKDGTWFVNTFIEYNIRLARTKDAGHGGFFGYHFVVLFLGCFPASVFAIFSFTRRYIIYAEKVDFTRWMRVLFWVVLILFSVVQSKIVHYSSMCYIPLTFLAALSLYRMVEDKYCPLSFRWAIAAVGGLIGLAVAVLPLIALQKKWLHQLFEADLFALKNLEAAVSWSLSESSVGFFYLLVVLSFPFLLRRVVVLRGVYVLFLCTAIFLNLTLIFFIAKIESYTQKAAVEFFISKKNEDCYIETYGYKSYAHLFYAQKRMPNTLKHSDESWLLRGDVDKPTYFVCKITSKAELMQTPTLSYLYEKNGFVFFQRKP